MSARVKKLVWELDRANPIAAISALGRYEVYSPRGSIWQAAFAKDGVSVWENLAWHTTRELAQSACQSHYENAVMALLEDENE